MTSYSECSYRGYIVRVKPEWMVALTEDEPVYRIYMHGGAQIVVDKTTENLHKLLERAPQA